VVHQVKTSLLWSSDIIEDFACQVNAFSEAVQDVEQLDAQVGASQLAASREVAKFAAATAPSELKHCADCHPIDQIEVQLLHPVTHQLIRLQELSINQLCQSRGVLSEGSRPPPFDPRDRKERLVALRPDAHALSGHLQSQLDTLLQKSEQAQARLEEAEIAQRDAQRTMDSALHAL
jgi:hypothetical protein